MDKLPQEILEIILREMSDNDKLYTIPFVCQKFNNIINTDQVWDKHMSIYAPNDLEVETAIEDPHYSRLLDRNIRLHRVDLYDGIIGISFFKKLASKKHLKILTFNQCQTAENSFPSRIVEQCERMFALLTNVVFYNCSFNALFIKCMASMESLKAFTLNVVYIIGNINECIDFFNKNCIIKHQYDMSIEMTYLKRSVIGEIFHKLITMKNSKIIKLHVLWNENVRGYGQICGSDLKCLSLQDVPILGYMQVQSEIKYLTNLKDFKLVVQYRDSIYQFKMSYLYNTTLETLNIRNAILTNESLVAISEGCHQLKCLTLYLPGMHLTSRGLTDFMEKAKNLTMFDISVTQQHHPIILDITFFEYAYNLTQLNFNIDFVLNYDTLEGLELPNLVSASFNSIDGYDIVSRCTNLDELHVQGTDPFRMITYLRNSLTISKLRISNPDGNDNFLQARSSHYVQRLEVLRFSYYSTINADIFSNVIMNNLLELHIYWCSKLTNYTLKCIGSSSPNLIKLSLASCYTGYITDVGMNVIIRKCAKLQVLKLSTIRLTGTFILNIPTKNEFTNLELDYCHISTEFKNQVRHLPFIHIMN